MRVHYWVLSSIIAIGLWLAQSSMAADLPNTVALKQVPRTSTRLDLRPPKITELFSQEAIDRVLRATRDPATIEEVEVEGRRSKAAPLPTPVVPGGILAPFWALAHPTQAWRILAPLPPDQADKANAPPMDATDPYRPPTLPPM